MSFTVQGAYDGGLYAVQVTDDERYRVVGSERIAALVQAWEGRNVQVTASGPVLKVTAGDPRSILALLSAKTRVSKVGGDVPQLLPPPRHPAVD